MEEQKMKRVLCLVLVCCMLLGLFPISALGTSGSSLPFHDVSSDNWFYSAVSHAYHNGIMSGTSATTFAPNMYFSRAMVVATLFRIHNDRPANDSDPRNSGFTDVPENQWFAPYITWARENAIVDGIGNNRFAPLNSVTRQEFATILHRFYNTADKDVAVTQGPQWNNFTDRDQIQSWAVDGLTWANYHGIITGRTPTTIVPSGITIRAESATILMRFSDMDNGGSSDVDLSTRVDLQPLLGRDFDDIQDLFGEPTSTWFSHVSGTMVYVFSSGLSVSVRPSDNVAVSFTFWDDGQDLYEIRGFHLGGLHVDSSRSSIRNIFGTPDDYIYFVNELTGEETNLQYVYEFEHAWLIIRKDTVTGQIYNFDYIMIEALF